MRRVLGIAWRVIKRLAIVGAVVMVLLLMPVSYVELACRGDARAQTYTPLIDPAFRRAEANTYLTYPEWHIVFAYDGLAQTLKRDDEHAFDYGSSVAGFWRSTCALMRVADAHGGADWGTRSTIHTIGVSFTAEMAMKAAYEETLGRLAAWTRGGNQKTPQDRVVADMAVDYAAFLRQTPWYEYPFARERAKLWAAPVDTGMRGWERRLGIGLEFTAKSLYAKAIAGAVAATGEADLTIRTIVAGLKPKMLASIQDVRVIRVHDRGVEIETPRYDRFTRILAEIAGRGGAIVEIAGNDDIMATLTVEKGAASHLPLGTVILRMTRDGFPGDRLLVDLKVADLAAFMRAHPIGDPGLEHVFDY